MSEEILITGGSGFIGSNLVNHFLKKQIPYNSIYYYLKRVFKDKDFKKYAIKRSPNINDIYKIDNWARKKTLSIINKKV